ncbi:MAG TPA: (deoxy)nucleoside triphosphate pyrophosphohydrolase [Myxococcaceae bacterium]|nr:(deoxy)nucleoside triphosphate pyrophosphohydrolase [Myxococcaceae bacterium]
MSSTDRRVRVVAALIASPVGSDRFLVQQRLPGARRGLLWEFPGGKVEQGESDEQALVRECREELGVELSVGQRRWTGSHRYEDLQVELAVYEAKIVSGSPSPLHARELRALSAHEMKSLPFCEADLPLLDALEMDARWRSPR